MAGNVDSMYRQLMQLPLFQGVSYEQLSLLIEKLPFHFLKFADGEQIIAAGERCTHLRFVVSGSVMLTTRLTHLNVELSQTLAAPNVLAPEFLFGRDTAYPFSATACGTAGILQLVKSDYVKMLQADKVFLFNILNCLSLHSQRFSGSLAAVKDGSVAERLAFFIQGMVAAGATRVELRFVQKDLCTLLGAQRATLLRALERLAGRGLLRHGPSGIVVDDVRSLLQAVK
ncbi:MAG: Crp/Fnr family transcriptional regulator [Muribaculaceae bacterium]|nr:Crp/Fnr family transcriptional regulator [Muribaculaceae bacterium]